MWYKGSLHQVGRPWLNQVLIHFKKLFLPRDPQLCWQCSPWPLGGGRVHMLLLGIWKWNQWGYAALRSVRRLLPGLPCSNSWENYFWPWCWRTLFEIPWLLSPFFLFPWVAGWLTGPGVSLGLGSGQSPQLSSITLLWSHLPNWGRCWVRLEIRRQASFHTFQLSIHPNDQLLAQECHKNNNSDS